MYYAYVLRSKKDGDFYTGITKDIERRLKEHNSGYQKSTKARRPFELILKEEFRTRIEARQREKHLKSGVGRNFLKLKYILR